MIQALFRELAIALGDDMPGYEFSRYSKQALSVFLNDGLKLFASRRPDLFTEFTKVELRPGIYQDARPELDNVFDIVAQLSAEDMVVTTLTGAIQSNTQPGNRWDKKTINTPDGGRFVIASALIDKSLNGRFIVQPSVPPGEKVWLLVKGFKIPNLPIEHAIDHDFSLPGPANIWPVIKWYVLSQCAMLDKDLATARVHLQTFAQLIGLTELGESYFEAGNLVQQLAARSSLGAAR
jgi:hypothetical protein